MSDESTPEATILADSAVRFASAVPSNAAAMLASPPSAKLDALQRLKPERRSIFDEFKKKTADLSRPSYTGTDDWLLKFLIARGWDLEKAEAMVRATVAWREENGANTILQSGYEVQKSMSHHAKNHFVVATGGDAPLLPNKCFGARQRRISCDL